MSELEYCLTQVNTHYMKTFLIVLCVISLLVGVFLILVGLDSLDHKLEGGGTFIASSIFFGIGVSGLFQIYKGAKK